MNFTKKFPKFNPNIVWGIILLIAITFSVIKIVMAVAPNPGHNFTEVSGSIATGNLIYGSATDVFSALASVAAGSYLRSAGLSTAPVWSTLTLPNAGTTGDILFASATNVIGNLADVAAGRFLVSGGVGVAPSYSATPALGVAGATLGTLSLAGNTSGVITIQPQAAAGTYNFNLPIVAGTAGQPLLSGGGVGAAMTFGTLAIAAGGTGLTATVDDGVRVGDSASASTVRTLPSCSGATTDKLLYNITTNTFSCGVDQTAGGGPTYVVTTADSASTASTLYQNITGLSWTLAASTRYAIECEILYAASATTIGLGISWTGPASPLLTTASMFSGITTQTVGGTTIVGNDTGLTTSASVATTKNHARFKGFWSNGTTAGTLQMRFAPETATASGIIIKAGSWCRYSTY